MQPNSKKLIAATVLALLVACSPSNQVSVARMQEVRRSVEASRVTFEQIASSLVLGPITWANRVSVRYKIGDEYRTENWDVALVPSKMKADFINFMSLQNVDVFSVHGERVNFVLHGVGIGPSGVTIGVLVAPPEQHDCTSVATPLKLDVRGLHCEKLGGLTYLYLYR